METGEPSRDGVGRPIRILHMSHSAILGGSPLMLLALARHFNQGRWQSAVISTDDGPVGHDLIAAGIEFFPVPMDTLRRSITSIPAIARRVRAYMPDIVHLHSQFAGFSGGIASRLAGCSNVVYKAAFPSFLTDWDLWRKIRNDVAERVTCACARQVVCVSEHDRREYLRRRLAPADRCLVIHSGADPNVFAAPPAGAGRDLRPSGVEHLIGFAGRLKDQKGLDVLLRAMPLVRQALPDATLLVAGDGMLMAEMRQLADSLGITDAVRFLGARSDIPVLMSEIDVLAVPSRFEPFGIVAVEGMAAGKPVIASRVGGLQEVIADGETGLLVEPENVTALADALVTVLRDRERARTMGRAGVKRARSRFSIEVMCEAYERLYLEMLHDRKASRL